MKQDRDLQGDVDDTVMLMMEGKQWRNLHPNLEQTCHSGSGGGRQQRCRGLRAVLQLWTTLAVGPAMRGC